MSCPQTLLRGQDSAFLKHLRLKTADRESPQQEYRGPELNPRQPALYRPQAVRQNLRDMSVDYICSIHWNIHSALLRLQMQFASRQFQQRGR